MLTSTHKPGVKGSFINHADMEGGPGGHHNYTLLHKSYFFNGSQWGRWSNMGNMSRHCPHGLWMTPNLYTGRTQNHKNISLKSIVSIETLF